VIDAVVNSVTGPALVHDEADLEGARALTLSDGGLCVVVRSDGTRRALTRAFDPDMAAAFRAVDACPLIRLDGTRVASQRPVRIALEHTSE
jgi:hypothetical protein